MMVSIPASDDPPPLIITAAITGGGAPGRRGPAQPVTPAAIASDALACARAGAAIVHVHARDEAGRTTSDPALAAALVARIRDAGCTALLALSAGDDGGRFDHAARLGLAGCGADIVSLAVGSFNAGSRLYDNAPAWQAAMAGAIAETGAAAEIEVFDTGHLAVLPRLAHLPAMLNLVFGVPGGMAADVGLLAWLATRLPAHRPWSVSAQGDDGARHHALLWAAFGAGGHVRTGIEDVRFPDDRPNAAMVAAWAEAAPRFGRPVATPAQARVMLAPPATANTIGGPR